MGHNGALAGSLSLLTAGIVPLGLGCAPIYPQMAQLTPSRFGTEHTQSLMGLQMACAYIGSLPLPSLLTPPLLPHALQPACAELVRASVSKSWETTVS